MKLPSSSSLLLASLAASSSSSSLSALAAPAGDCPESLSSPVPVPPHAPVPHGSDDTRMTQPDNHLQTRGLVDPVLDPLPLGLGKAVKDIIHDIFGQSALNARGGPLDVVKGLPVVGGGKTLRAEGVDEAGLDGASEDSSSQPAASASAAAEGQESPPNPSDDCSSQASPQSGPIRSQEAGAADNEKPGESPNSELPPAAPSDSGADADCSG